MFTVLLSLTSSLLLIHPLATLHRFLVVLNDPVLQPLPMFNHHLHQSVDLDLPLRQQPQLLPLRQPLKDQPLRQYPHNPDPPNHFQKVHQQLLLLPLHLLSHLLAFSNKSPRARNDGNHTTRSLDLTRSLLNRLLLHLRHQPLRLGLLHKPLRLWQLILPLSLCNPCFLRKNLPRPPPYYRGHWTWRS